MPPSEWEAFDLSVAAKVIQHISSGIYRTPGGAVKELVSNSFDAGASFASVRTGFPRHESFVVTDDGVGMDEELIRASFAHVGASVKVRGTDFYTRAAKGRPIIGQFGIGMLAAAHISHKITITTYPKSEPDRGLECELNLEPFFEIGKEIKTLAEVALGTVRFRTIPRAGHSPGTVVVLPQVDKTSNFYRTLTRGGKRQFVAKWPAANKRVRDNGKAMAEFVHALQDAALTSTNRLSGREQLLWELGLITPVKYLPGGPVQTRFLDGKARTIIEELVSDATRNSFTMFFDGIEVRKPILLPSPKGVDSYVEREEPSLSEHVTVFPIEVAKTEAGVSARGYLVLQPNVLHPRELQGLYPRVHGVGVGSYDNTLFKGLEGESPILRVRLSGEVYIEGIDRAINLDRSGFNELTKEFQSLQDGLNGVLQGPGAILSEAKKRLEEHSERVSEVKARVRAREALTVVERSLKRFGVEKKVSSRPPARRPAPTAIAYPFVTVVDETGEVQVDPAERDPRLAQIIIVVDNFLSELPDGFKLRRELAERLRRALRL